MVAKAFLLVLMACLAASSAQEVLQEVLEDSEGLREPLADAIERLAAQGKQWLFSHERNGSEEGQGRKEDRRMGRMLEDEEKEASGRIFFDNGSSDQEITISLPGLISGFFIVILALLFFKVLAAIITGRDLSSWTDWADGFIRPPSYPPSYYTDHSSYTAYRALEDVPQKYK